MVDAAGQRFHDSFHLQSKEQGCELPHGDVRLYRNDILLQVVVLLQETDNGLFFFRQGGEELTLDALFPRLLDDGIVLPAHRHDEIFG